MENDEKQIYLPEVLTMVQPGEAVQVFFGEANVNNEIRHIRAIVDSEYVVYRVWSKHKGRWLYQVGDLMEFQVLWFGCNLIKLRVG